jgi:hypothetical protein
LLVVGTLPTLGRAEGTMLWFMDEDLAFDLDLDFV